MTQRLQTDAYLTAQHIQTTQRLKTQRWRHRRSGAGGGAGGAAAGCTNEPEGEWGEADADEEQARSQPFRTPARCEGWEIKVEATVPKHPNAPLDPMLASQTVNLLKGGMRKTELKLTRARGVVACARARRACVRDVRGVRGVCGLAPHRCIARVAATWGRPKHTEASTPACQEAQALQSAAIRSLRQALACLGPRPEPAHLRPACVVLGPVDRPWQPIELLFRVPCFEKRRLLRYASTVGQQMSWFEWASAEL